MKLTRLILIIGVWLNALPAYSQKVKDNVSIKTAVNWQAFLNRSDMVWNTKLPDSWDRGIFLGNGCFGTIFWVNNNGAFNFEVSRGDLYDHRNDPKNKTILYTTNRLPNGHFELALGKDKPTGNMRLDLWNAEARGQIQNGANNYNIRCFTAADRNVIILEVTGNTDHRLQWFPDTAKSTRKGAPKSYQPYPTQVLQQKDGIDVSVQEMPEDAQYATDGKGAGQYATAWFKQVNGNKSTYYISMGFSYPGTTAVKEAVDLINKAKKSGVKKLETSHRDWWHNYYPKSFVSVPDAAMESFYWIQMYKMGSASRQGGPILDLMGPWFMRTGWPAIWWNLNIQLAYWPFYMSNHLEEAEPLRETVWKARDMLAQNAAPYQNDSYAIGRASAPGGRSPVGGEVGNLPWTMHNLWMHYRSTMDDKYLKNQLFPLMKGSFNYLKHIVVKQPDGKWSLPKTASPEYSDAVLNSNYTLACLRWLANTLIAADERLKANDPIVNDCKELLTKLVPYEVDNATGLMVGKDLPFTKSHRHWSHLFMVYPFNEYTWDNPAQAPLIKKSLENWVSMPEAFAGYSYLGAASILAAGGRGDESLNYLQSFLKKAPQANTLYREGFPVIETPLAFGRTLQELLMTSHGDLIRIFPGIPSTWKDVVFADLRAEGAFLVSARRTGGKTDFIQIKSLAGELCRVNTGIIGQVKVTGIDSKLLKDLGNGIVELTLKKGETATLYSGNNFPKISIQPVNFMEQRAPWGERKPF
ncbi:MAG: alpha-L-fucosidase [Sphingobacteriales bacterium]|nr:alpha-L-fucosidase [Sphingobacteriales bacterium]